MLGCVVRSQKLNTGEWEHLVSYPSGSTRTLSRLPTDQDLIDWLAFRRAILASPEYVLAVSLALENPGIAVADSKLTSAIDACLNQGAEPEEIAAFQSAIALYFAQLDIIGTAETETIKAALIETAQNYFIAL